MQPSKIHCCHKKHLDKTETPIFNLLCVFCFQGQPLKTLFTNNYITKKKKNLYTPVFTIHYSEMCGYTLHRLVN